MHGQEFCGRAMDLQRGALGLRVGLGEGVGEVQGSSGGH